MPNTCTDLIFQHKEYLRKEYLSEISGYTDCYNIQRVHYLPKKSPKQKSQKQKSPKQRPERTGWLDYGESVENDDDGDDGDDGYCDDGGESDDHGDDDNFFLLN